MLLLGAFNNVSAQWNNYELQYNGGLFTQSSVMVPSSNLPTVPDRIATAGTSTTNVSFKLSLGCFDLVSGTPSVFKSLSATATSSFANVKIKKISTGYLVTANRSDDKLYIAKLDNNFNVVASGEKLISWGLTTGMQIKIVDIAELRSNGNYVLIGNYTNSGLATSDVILCVVDANLNLVEKKIIDSGATLSELASSAIAINSSANTDTYIHITGYAEGTNPYPDGQRVAYLLSVKYTTGLQSVIKHKFLRPQGQSETTGAFLTNYNVHTEGLVIKPMYKANQEFQGGIPDSIVIGGYMKDWNHSVVDEDLAFWIFGYNAATGGTNDPIGTEHIDEVYGSSGAMALDGYDLRINDISSIRTNPTQQSLLHIAATGTDVNGNSDIVYTVFDMNTLSQTANLNIMGVANTGMNNNKDKSIGIYNWGNNGLINYAHLIANRNGTTGGLEFIGVKQIAGQAMSCGTPMGANHVLYRPQLQSIASGPSSIINYTGITSVAGLSFLLNSTSSNFTYICGSSYWRTAQTEVVDDNFITSLEVSPNPAKDNIRLQIPTNMSMTKLTILNLNGQLVMEKTLDSETKEFNIDIQSLPNAMYILKVEGAGKPQMTKFIKE